MTRLLPKRAPTPRLILAVALLAVAPGCETLYGSRPLVVQVRDIETKKPLDGAQVHITYPMAESPFAPPDGRGTTGADGMARLQAAPYGEFGIALEVSADHYIPADKTMTAAAVQALEPAHWFEHVERRPASLIVELYAEPHPMMELVLPVGFRGVVKAELVVLENTLGTPGQRLFSGVMGTTGVVQVTGPPLLRGILASDTRARFADGSPISRQPNETEIGIWWLSSREPGPTHLLHRHPGGVCPTPPVVPRRRLGTEAVLQRQQEQRRPRTGRPPWRAILIRSCLRRRFAVVVRRQGLDLG